MVSESIDHVVGRVSGRLDQLREYYLTFAKGSPEQRAQLATFLAGREADTIRALEEWLDSEPSSAKAWIRQGDCFPYEPVVQTWPPLPTEQELIDIGRETDDQLERLLERIETYVTAEQPADSLMAVRRLVGRRRERLDAAVREREHGC